MIQENSLIKGTILKGIGGFYYVEALDNIFECKAKGQFRKNRIVPMVGDNVLIKLGKNGSENVIKEIEMPRKNEFIRPPVANIELSVIVAAVCEPEPVFSFVDKLLIMSEKNNTEIILVFNKCDLISEDEINCIKDKYMGTGYEVYFVSTYSGRGIEELRNRIKDKKSMLSGASGVGKSSLANALGGFEMEIGDISRKTQRGKQTTRHVELLKGNDGIKIFDTPGFTSFEIMDIKPDELKLYYPEFEDYEEKCRFTGCRHISEPDCGVKAALAHSLISQMRYDSYIKIYNELKEKPVVY